MSLEPEKWKKLLDIQTETLQLVKKVLDVMSNLKGEVDDQLADMQKDLLAKIHELDSFAHNILEANQKILYNKMLDIAGQEIEPKETSESG